MRYILVLLLGVGIGVGILLIAGYDKQAVNQQPLKTAHIATVDKPTEDIEPKLAIETVSKSEEIASSQLNRKIDRLADSLLSLKSRVDSLSNFQISDTIIFADSAKLVLDSIDIRGEEIVVQRDVLLSTELVKIEFSDLENEIDSSNVLIDSLKSALNIMADPAVEFLKIELWKSPLNYRGYKMSKSTLVIYGLINELVIKVYADEECIFLTTNEANYQFEQTVDFKELCIVAKP